MITKSTINFFRKHLLEWFDIYGRHDLPWQIDINSYKVWLSEIMLQQTQVQTVIPYYERFLQRFPTLNSLATAQLDDVLSYWAGLGYYRRARFLHQCAQIVYDQHQSKFPKSLAALVDLPGIGQSTAGAILSLSMNKRGVILDGNVKRVLSRFLAIKEPLNESKGMKNLWLIAEALTPTSRNNNFNQAMMDMGATCCTRSKPSCDTCPLQKKCLAFAEGDPAQYPVRPIKTKAKPKRETIMLILVNQQNQIFLQKRPVDGIWPQLFSFPETDLQTAKKIDLLIKKSWNLSIIDSETLKPFTHQFTHFNLKITPVVCYVQNNGQPFLTDNNYLSWYDLDYAKTLGIPTPVKRILKSINIEATI